MTLTGQATPSRRSPSPDVFELAKLEPETVTARVDTNTTGLLAGGHIEQSAADYDPSLDRKIDDERRAIRDGIGEVEVDKKEESMDVDEEEEEEDDDLDDMFAVATKDVKKSKKTKVHDPSAR